MNQRNLLLILIVLVIGFGGYYIINELMPKDTSGDTGTVYSTHTVAKGDITVGVQTSGQLNSSRDGGLVVPGSFENGSVQYLLVDIFKQEGDEVMQGDVVAKLDSKNLEAKIAEKKATLEQKMKQLADLTNVSVDNLGSIQPNKGITISAPISGKITDLTIKEGKEVEVGAVVAYIVDDSSFKVDFKLYEYEYSKVKVGDLVKLNFPYFDGAVDGKITYLNPNKVLNTVKDGFAKGYVYQGTIEAVNPGLVQKEMNVKVGLPTAGSPNVMYLGIDGVVSEFGKEEKIVNTVKSIATDVHVEDMAMVEAGDKIITMASKDVQDDINSKLEEISSLRSELNLLQAQMGDLEIKAPMDGIVGGFWRQKGEMVNTGDWIGSVYNVTDMMIYTEVDDIDVIYIQQGAACKVTVDALPNDTFEGVVKGVNSMGKDMTGVTKFMVNISVKGSGQLRPGMQANAQVSAGSATGVILVPVEALFDEDGQNMVEVLKDGAVKIVNVQVGLINNRYAEITEGVQEGDEVITGSTSDLLPSQHIGTKDGLLPDAKPTETNKENTSNGN
jgi:multidrug efflux pump subunit AcrA (membrane-fusion protein)